MTVYVDPLHNFPTGLWCHMWADTEEELDAFAKKMNLKPQWKQISHGTLIDDYPHYDLRSYRRTQAMNLGAQPLTLKEWIQRQTKLNEPKHNFLDTIDGDKS